MSGSPRPHPLRTAQSQSSPSSHLGPPNQFQDDSSEPTSSLVHLSQPSTAEPSRNPSPFVNLPHPDTYRSAKGEVAGEEEDDSDFEAWNEQDPLASSSDMPSDLRSPKPDGRSSQPLLSSDKSQKDYASPHRPSLTPRRSTFRERDPGAAAAQATKKRYTYAAAFLLLSLVSFTIQTETAVYIQHTLKWNKAYCML